MKEADPPVGRPLEVKVQAYDSQQKPKILFVRFREEYEAALLYKAINFYYEAYVKGSSGYLRSYFSKEK